MGYQFTMQMRLGRKKVCVVNYPLDMGGNFLHQNDCEVLEQAAWGGDGVPIPRESLKGVWMWC